MKYIIEIKPEYEDSFKGLMILGVKDSNLFVDTLAVENLEELNSDYINEHYGQLQQDAYDKGYKDGRNVTETQAHNDAYQRGLEDAWECGKKLAWTAKYGGYGERLNDVFGRDDTFDFYDYTPNEAIEKLKAFEQKQDKIKVGDEVIERDGNKILVSNIHGELFDGLCSDGSTICDLFLEDVVKTGRHFDIASILEDMRK